MLRHKGRSKNVPKRSKAFQKEAIMEDKILIEALLRAGISQTDIAEMLAETSSNSHLEAKLDLLHKLASTSKESNTTDATKSWVEQQDGWFDANQLDKELGLITPQQKSNRRKVIMRLKEQGVVEANRSQSGKYRFINTEVDKIDWQNADASQRLNVKWAFPIHELCYLVPGNIVVVAGSSDSGKTALLLDFTARNLYDYNINYFSSEMGEVELKGRIDLFEQAGITPVCDWAEVNFMERSRDFADVVEPNKINIIDYLEMNDNFFAVGGTILSIWEKLAGTGLAVIAIQKEPKADLGRGGQFSMEKARLYLTMDYNKLTIKKGKNRMNPAVNPNNRSWTFQNIWGGCKFLNIVESVE